MKTILVSLTAVLAIAAGAAVYLTETGNRKPDTGEMEKAKVTGVAMAKELDRLQTLRFVLGKIEANERKLAGAEEIVKGDELYQSGKWQIWSGQEVTEQALARAQDAREALAELRAQRSALLASK